MLFGLTPLYVFLYFYFWTLGAARQGSDGDFEGFIIEGALAVGMPLVRLGKMQLRWCHQCSLPVLEDESCGLCGGPTQEVQVTPPGDILKSEFVHEASTNPEYIKLFRDEYAYHPFHAFSMIACGQIALQRTSAVFIPGAEKPEYARGMGCIPTATFEEAMEQAVKITGPDPKIICTPEAFSGGAGVHLYLKK